MNYSLSVIQFLYLTMNRIMKPTFQILRRIKWGCITKVFRTQWGRYIECLKVKSESEVTQSCPTLCNSMDCSPSGFSIHGVFQAIILEWVAISFSRGSSPPRDWTQVSCIEGRCFTPWATREVLFYLGKKVTVRVHAKNMNEKTGLGHRFQNEQGHRG